MVFASLIVVGLSTLIQVRRLGGVGAGAVLPMFTAAFSIPFCITAVTDGGPATLAMLVEQEISLRLLRNYASSVRHQQFHDTDIITVRVEAPGVG